MKQNGKQRTNLSVVLQRISMKNEQWHFHTKDSSKNVHLLCLKDNISIDLRNKKGRKTARKCTAKFMISNGYDIESSETEMSICCLWNENMHMSNVHIDTNICYAWFLKYGFKKFNISIKWCGCRYFFILNELNWQAVFYDSVLHIQSDQVFRTVNIKDERNFTFRRMVFTLKTYELIF